VNLKVISLDEWKVLAEEAHMLCFQESRHSDTNTFDYALLVTDKDDKPVAYSTIIEMDKATAYMQHGGSFPEFAKGIYVARAYQLMVAYLKEQYTKISTRILNTNISMLKLALSAELYVNGIDFLGGEIFLNASWVKSE